MKLEDQIKELDTQRAKLVKRLINKKGNMTFQCVCCGERHKIKDCVAIQTHFYIQPHGCTEGDYWLPGEVQIICPTTGDTKNRILFSEFEGKHNLNREQIHEIEQQFRFQYLPLFKEVRNDYGENRMAWRNNFYFNRNIEQFFGSRGNQDEKIKKL